MDITVQNRDSIRLPALSERDRGRLVLTDKQAREVRSAQEVFDRLAQHLLRSAKLVAPWALGVTSSIQGEGKTTCSIGLAMALAREARSPVALIEGDLANPSLARDFGIDAGMGIVGWLLGRSSVETAVQPTDVPNLRVLPAGDGWEASESVAEASTEKLRRRLPELRAALVKDHPYIVVDLPPLLKNANAEGMSRLLTGTILVVQAGVTPISRVREAAQFLDGVPLTAVVHIGQPSAIPQWLSSLFSE